MDYGYLKHKIKTSDLPDKYKETLNSNLEEIKKSGLNQEKVDELSQKYESLKELAKIKKSFLENKERLSTLSKLKISNIITELENKEKIGKFDLDNLERNIISDKDLNNRKDILGISLGSSYRDFVKSNIDFVGISETFGETNFIKDFYNNFGINYRIFVENKYGKVMDFENQEGLNLTKSELIEIIKKTTNEVYSNKINNYQDIQFKVVFNLSNGQQVVQEIKKADEKDKENKAKSNIKKDKEKTSPKVQTHNIVKKSKIEHIKVKNVGNVLNSEEKKVGFLYSEFIEKYGLPESSKKLLLSLIKDCLDGEKATVRVDLGEGKYEDRTISYTNKKKDKGNYFSIEKHFPELVQNLEKIIVLSLNIESSGGKNVANYNNSGAEGYFQLHTKNGATGYEKLEGGIYKEINKDEYLELKQKNTKGIREVKKPNSFETAIGYLAKVYENSEKDGKVKIPVLGGKVIDKQKKSIIGINHPTQLTASEQTNLWLADLFSRIKDDRKKHLANMLVGSQWDAKQFYNKVQHTAPDEKTEEVVNSFMADTGKMKVLI